MPNFCPISVLPFAGRAAERNSSNDRRTGLTISSEGSCTMQNPVLRLLLYLAVILLALTMCCAPIMQVNEKPEQLCPKDQLRPLRPAETWEQVKLGYEELAFFCPTKNVYLLQKFCTNSVILQEQSNGAERAKKHGQAFRLRHGKVSRESSDGMNSGGKWGVRAVRRSKGELITLPVSSSLNPIHVSRIPQPMPKISPPRISNVVRPSNQLQPDAGGNGHDNNSRGDIPNQRRRLLQIGRSLLRERQTTTFQWYPRRPPAALELLRANYSNPEASPIRDKKKPRSRAVNVDLGLSFGTHPRGEQ